MCGNPGAGAGSPSQPAAISAIASSKRASDERSGAYSCLIGIAADRCFEHGQLVRIGELVTGLTPPPLAPMPTHTGPVPMPQRIDMTG